MVNLEEINRDVIGIMKRHYGDRLAKIVLFGSYARGDFHEDSDMDYLVELYDEKVSLSREISRLSSDLNAILLDKQIHISAKPVSIKTANESGSPFFREVRREGKTIYERQVT